MISGRRHAILLAAAMGGTAVVGLWFRPAHTSAQAGRGIDLDRVLPDRFGDWALDREATAFVRAADVRGRQVGFYDQVLERTFVHTSGARVMLSVAYLGAQSSDMQLHRPEVCYRAGGFRVDGVHAATLPLADRQLPVTQLLAEMPGRPEPITYWTVVGGTAVSGQTQGWRERLQAALRRQGADGTLVRISSIGRDTVRAYALHAGFAADMAAVLDAANRDVMIGSLAPAP